MKFEELNLNPRILEQIKKEGFSEPTEIQKKCIPEIKKGKDVVGQSLTGSGKTVAFSIPVLEQVAPKSGIQALVLTPTRELCVQVKDTFETFGRAINVCSAAIYGGTGMEPQIDALRRSEIVVATPGRLLDHMRRGSIRFDRLKFLVLDEVDKMFDMGFIDDVDTIIKSTPKNKQTLLFSATIPDRVHALIRKYMRFPVILKAQTTVDKSLLKQSYYDIGVNEKFSLLVHLLRHKTTGFAMVFCQTRRHTDVLTKNLQNNGINAMAIHGGLTQNKRLHALNSLKKAHIDVLVATDVAARGLDIKNVTHVYNYDVPKTSEEYIHRIGRTARAGNNGDAITILSQKDYENFRRVLEDRTLDIKKEELPNFEKIRFNTFKQNRHQYGRSPRDFQKGGFQKRRY